MAVLLVDIYCRGSRPRIPVLITGAPPPGPGVLFPRRKSTQKGARETLSPFFAQSDAYKRGTQLPLNFCGASGLLVIGAVLCRTTPDGPAALSKHAGGMFVA